VYRSCTREAAGACLWTVSVSILEEFSAYFSPGTAFFCGRCGRKAGGYSKDHKGKEAQRETELCLLRVSTADTRLHGQAVRIKDSPKFWCTGAETLSRSRNSGARSYSSTEKSQPGQRLVPIYCHSPLKYCFHLMRDAAYCFMYLISNLFVRVTDD